MSKFNEKYNLAEWALNHKQLLYYFIVVLLIGGLFSYQKLGRMEDADFTIRQMIVTASWPGSTARQMEEQVTDKIEKKLQDTPGLDYVKSYSTPGKAVITVVLEDTVDAKEVRPTWLEVRNLVNDIRNTLPEGVTGISYNDRFDDVYGCIYALTGDGYSYEDMREKAEKIRRVFLAIPTVKKANLLGVQSEKIYIEIENSKLSQLGIDPNLIISISGLAVGDKVMIPGTDVFGKAITKLWRQNLISDVEISFTKLEGTNLYIQFEITERPRLNSFKFEGIRKGERDELLLQCDSYI